MAPYDAAPPSPSISTSPVDFKEVLAHLASGVAIVSCWDGDTPRGLLVSSITGLSVEPPRFLFCVRKEAGCHDALLTRSHLGVALLGSTDEDEALRFASSHRAGERFTLERWRRAASAPVYRGGLASAVCEVEQVVDAATHSIFIVTASEVAFAPGPALVSWNRALSRLG
ncbi:flavin reductase family protein [Caulobacter sp. RL271]|jgi:flavin reductase (NADH)|uniref:Flavin reductase family protein n=1 Tax=Caulobacter segnis TaxID=88688 RepID=A0ABY5A0F5_9CAUL|nr:flavin reductase family protein [Caulobacter segnis]USQ98293.1 flavin reductase family protein [Caulobacter segnis]